MNFGQALEVLKEGRLVARKGWNGKKMHLWLNKGIIATEPVGDDFTKEDADATMKELENNPEASLIEGVHLELFEYGDTDIVTRMPNINMKTASGATVTGWLASQTDMLAEDWVEIANY